MSARTASHINRLPQLEDLEPRLLLSLVGVALQFPDINYDSNGAVAYTASTQSFDSTATPLAFQMSSSSRPNNITAPRDFQLHIKVNSQGNLVGGVPGNDLEVDGTVTISGITYTGALLTGEIVQFGYLDNGNVDQYDFRFRPSGGALAQYFIGKDIGLLMTSEHSSFNDGDLGFTVDFDGGAKGVIGPIDALPPGIRIVKDAGASIVGPNVPVTFTYTVTNTGSVPLSNIVVTDDNATPDFAADDFSPTPVLGLNGKNIGDLNGDGMLDPTEVWKYSATVIPPIVMTVTPAIGGPTYDSGTLSFLTLPNGDVRVFYLQSDNFNDNTYGTGSDAGWTSQGKTHKFGDLTGSDKAGFLVKYADGTTLAQFYMDYITASTTQDPLDGYSSYSGYRSLGFSGGDGSFITGNSAVLKDFDSTLELDLNQPGIANNGVAYTAMTVNSPVGDAKWDVVDGYYFTIDKSAFAGGKSFGGVTIFDQHNSPAKTGGSNTYIPKIEGHGSANTATVTGIGNGETVTDDDVATVLIVTGPLGSLGDRVWLDLNANGVQDAGEPGIVGATVLLQGDLDKDGTIDYTDTRTTGPDGIYTFTGLPAGEYKVTVIAATLPANYVQTYDLDGLATANSALGELSSGQNRTDFDFGYVPSAPGFTVVKTANKTTAAPGESVTYTYMVSNTGASPLTNVVLKDDNATPNFAGDDFNPTYVSGDDGNGQLDPGETWQYTATIIPPVQMTVTVNGAVYDSGSLSYTTLANGDIRVAYRQSLNVNDNTYGTGSDIGWTSQGKVHKFGDLTGSDKAGFEVKYSDGTTLVKFYQDYITASGTATSTYSGYQSLGYSGGDGSLVSGNGSVLKDFDSSLELDLNRPGYTTVTVNSPVGDPNWDAVDAYYFTISASAFTGGKSFGGVTIFDQHNSPPKIGSSNSLIPTVVGGESVNTAIVTAKLDGSTVVAVGDASVLVGPPGSVGGTAKFFVADIGADDVFKYSAASTSVGSFAMQSGNTDSRDIAANADGSKLWVLDKDKNVNVYKADGTALGVWKADGVGKEPEGITLDGNSLWVADRDRKIHWFKDAAANTTGTDKSDKNFSLSVSGNVKAIVTDGNNKLWVVTEGGTDYVYRFTIARDGSGTPTGLTKDGMWKLATANSKPTGITLDPTGASQSLWIVDESTDTVYEYANARALTSGTGVVSASFKLAPTNVAPQGIADPPPSNDGVVASPVTDSNEAASVPLTNTSDNTVYVNALAAAWSNSNGKLRDVNFADAKVVDTDVAALDLFISALKEPDSLRPLAASESMNPVLDYGTEASSDLSTCDIVRDSPYGPWLMPVASVSPGLELSLRVL